MFDSGLHHHPTNQQVEQDYSGPKKLDHDFESNPW